MIKVGFLHSRVRVEEKLLLEELTSRPQTEIVRINDGADFFDSAGRPQTMSHQASPKIATRSRAGKSLVNKNSLRLTWPTGLTSVSGQ